MEKPNYRIGIGSENGIAKIITGVNLKNYTGNIDERTFWCSCQNHENNPCSCHKDLGCPDGGCGPHDPNPNDPCKRYGG